MNIIFQCIPFADFSLGNLYEAMQLRQNVFVVEQDCPYLDADGQDQEALHLLGYDADNKNLVAYSRLFKKGTIYEKYAVIGRVVTSQSIRGRGIGYLLMKESIRQLETHFGASPIKISAQFHLQSFYKRLGFRSEGSQYLEDGIPHIAMMRH